MRSIQEGNEGCGRRLVTGGLWRRNGQDLGLSSPRAWQLRPSTLGHCFPVCVKPFVGLLQLEGMAGSGCDLDPSPQGT